MKEYQPTIEMAHIQFDNLIWKCEKNICFSTCQYTRLIQLSNARQERDQQYPSLDFLWLTSSELLSSTTLLKKCSLYVQYLKRFRYEKQKKKRLSGKMQS